MNLAQTATELDEFLEKVVGRSIIEIKEIEFTDQSDWNLIDGALSHRTGGFFDIIGLEDSTGREHLMLYQPQSALTGLAICRDGDEVYILLQARIEPGNTGIGQYGPTIQSTPANYLALHGGNKTNILDLFYRYNSLSTPCGSSMQLDLGERYLQKSKWHNYALVDTFLDTEDHMIWVSLTTLNERLEKSNYLNADLRSLLSVFNWNKLSSPEWGIKIAPDLDYPISRLAIYRNSLTSTYKLKSLAHLKNWQIETNGIFPVGGEDVSIKMYYTNCHTREVALWYQPLMYVQSRGEVILMTRKRNADLECLLTIRRETGIDHGYLITASHIINPGDINLGHEPESDDMILHEFIQCDEGGRFFQHESIYRVILTNQEIKTDKNQFWISMSGLKFILSMSNIASLQLRCISSLFLFPMNNSLHI